MKILKSTKIDDGWLVLAACDEGDTIESTIEEWKTEAAYRVLYHTSKDNKQPGSSPKIFLKSEEMADNLYHKLGRVFDAS